MTGAARTVAGSLLGVVALVVVAILLSGGGDRRTLRLTLDDAAGLRDGSPVSVGGVRVGTVKLKLDDDKVHVTLRLDEGKSVPRDAHVGISAVNFLGQKQVAFSGGTPSDPAPDGYEIPAARVTTSTDLDQVLDTLDNDTRTRLAILVNEAGAAVAGRRWDISHDLEQLPTTLADAHTLLSRLVTDNHTLADVVTSSDRFIAATTAKREDLNRMIDTLGQTSQTVEAKRAELAATLAKAPGTLATLQRFLGRLEQTTVPLGPAARAITATAPALDQTLSRVEGFRRSADPTLNTAAALAPALTRLGTQATPVVRQAQPTLRSLARLVPAAAPLVDAVQHSANNIFGTVENWSQAIQLRDGLSHIFRGEATYSPDAVASVLDRLTKPAAAATGSQKKQAGPAPAPSAPAGPAAKPQAPSAADAVTQALKTVEGITGALQGVGGKATDTVKGLVGGVKGPAPGPATPKQGENAAQALLDYLLSP